MAAAKKKPKAPAITGYKVHTMTHVCVTKDGVQACGKTEAEAVKLLQKTLAERK